MSFFVTTNTFNVIYRHGGRLITKDDGVVMYINGEYKVSVCSRDTTYEDFLVKAETICNLKKFNFSLQCVVDESPPITIACEADYTLMMATITETTNVICVWMVGDPSPAQGNNKGKSVQRNLFQEDLDWAKQPDYSSFSTPLKLVPLPSQYMLSPPSAEKLDVPVRCKGKGLSSDPVVIETPPPPAQFREVAYIPNIVSSGNYVMCGSSSKGPSGTINMSAGNDFIEAALILDEMQLDKGFCDQYKSQIVQEDEKVVALGNDEDSEATLWDSEVDVLDSPRSWNTEDILNDMMYDDSSPMFGDDNRSPNLKFDLNESPKSPIGTFNLNLDVSPREHYSPPFLNSLEQQLNDEMYDDSQPMFGPFPTPETTQMPDLNDHSDDTNVHPADINEDQVDMQG